MSGNFSLYTGAAHLSHPSLTAKNLRKHVLLPLLCTVAQQAAQRLCHHVTNFVKKREHLAHPMQMILPFVYTMSRVMSRSDACLHGVQEHFCFMLFNASSETDTFAHELVLLYQWKLSKPSQLNVICQFWAKHYSEGLVESIKNVTLPVWVSSFSHLLVIFLYYWSMSSIQMQICTALVCLSKWFNSGQFYLLWNWLTDSWHCKGQLQVPLCFFNRLAFTSVFHAERLIFGVYKY